MGLLQSTGIVAASLLIEPVAKIGLCRGARGLARGGSVLRHSRGCACVTRHSQRALLPAEATAGRPGSNEVLVLTRMIAWEPAVACGFSSIFPFLPNTDCRRRFVRCWMISPFVNSTIPGAFASALARQYWNRVRTCFFRERPDVVWVEKEFLPWVPAGLKGFLLRGLPSIVDYDDATFHNYDLHSNRSCGRCLAGRLTLLCVRPLSSWPATTISRNGPGGRGLGRVEILPTVWTCPAIVVAFPDAGVRLSFHRRVDGLSQHNPVS